MKAHIDGNAVFVAPDDFINLQVSPAVFGTVTEFLTAAVMAYYAKAGNEAKMVVFDLQPEGDFDGLIPRVTIEWVDPRLPSAPIHYVLAVGEHDRPAFPLNLHL